jgi:hypothetical protein
MMRHTTNNPEEPGRGDAPVADALVLTLTRGMSLGEWERLGLLEREWGLYERLAGHYRTIVVLSYGDEAAERAIAAGLSPAPIVIAPADARDTPARVRAALGGAASVVVKTNQMDGVGPAIRVTRDLRAHGVCVGLVGRGGYLRSRFAADQFGPASRQAAEAAAEEHDLCAAADVIVGTTPEMAHALSWRYGVPFDRTRVIPNFVLVEGGAEGAGEREPVVLYAGQLVARKRVHMLIEAMARLSPPNRQSTLSIIGEGPEEGALRGLASELGVRAAFEKRIGHADLLRRMARASVYAQASSLEGHPKTVIEAMASGAAVVVTDAPGMGDVLTHGVTGLRVDSQAGAIADAVDLLLTDQAWREQLGNAAAHVAQERYGLGTILPRELEAHRMAIASAGRFVRADAGVRWDASLPDAGAEAGGAWERSLAAFARRLEAGEAEAVLGQIERAAAGLRAAAGRERRAAG